MARREGLADIPDVAEPLARADIESSQPLNAERQHRNGAPIRRSQRLHLELPVFAYGRSPNKEPLLQVAHTLVVYARGALLALEAAVEPGQELMLVNPKTELEAACRVATCEPEKNGSKFVVEVELTQPAPKFWGVVFPPENWDPAERKLPRVPRRHGRVECSQPVRVRPFKESANHFDDVSTTQNISQGSLYFISRHLGYRKSMRLMITFLSQSDFFAPKTNCAGQIVRVDQREDGHVGVAVKLFGRTNRKPPAVPTSSQRKVCTPTLGVVFAFAPSNLWGSFLDKGIRIVCWPAAYFRRISQLTAKRAKALTRLWNTGAKLWKTTIARSRYQG